MPSAAPPVYQQEDPVGASCPPKYPVDKPIPLPTYAQSEKFEKDGVLPASASPDGTADGPPRRRWPSENGSCFEFVLFFIGKEEGGWGQLPSHP